MIYLTSTTERQQIMIPNVYGFTPGQEAQLLILSTVDLVEFAKEYAAGGSFDARAFSAAFRIGASGTAQLTADGRYVIFFVQFNEAPVVGSWEYRLIQDGHLAGGGCCQVGKYGEEESAYVVPVERFDTTIQYEQYD